MDAFDSKMAGQFVEPMKNWCRNLRTRFSRNAPKRAAEQAKDQDQDNVGEVMEPSPPKQARVEVQRIVQVSNLIYYRVHDF